MWLASFHFLTFLLHPTIQTSQHLKYTIPRACDHTCHTLRTPNAKKALTIPVIPLCDNPCDEDEHGHAK